MNVNEMKSFDIENSRIEYKLRLDQKKQIDWLKTVAGFANAQGGNLYVGIEDQSGNLCGFTRQEADSERNRFNNEVNQHLTPIPKMQINFLPYTIRDQERYILEIKVFESAVKPVIVKWQGVPAIYMRREGFTNGATYEEIIQMSLKCSQKPYDLLATEIPYKSENFTTLQDFSRRHNDGKELTEKQLHSMGFFDDQGMLVRGAELFMDHYQGGKTDILCSMFSGFSKGSNRITTLNRFQGNLTDTLEAAAEFVMQRMNHAIVKLSDSRMNISAFPERALFEGIVNAAAHRDYFIDGTQIQIDMYRDRLEISSPGSFYNTRRQGIVYDLNNLISTRRNQLITSVLVACNVMEAAGTGFEKIIEDYSSADENHRPFGNLRSTQFTLTLPDLTYQTGVESTQIQLEYMPIPNPSKYDQQIMSYCWPKSHTLKEIAEHLGITVSTYLRSEILENLVKGEYLIREKRGRTSIYRTNREMVHES